MNIFTWIYNLIFPKPKFHILPPKVAGDLVYTPTISMNGDWSNYISQPYDNQNQGTWDEQNCISQAGINCIEAILNYYLKNNLFPQILSDFLKNNGYLNAQGFVKLSTRFSAKMAGTTKQGLGIDAFWQSINRDGFLPATAYPEPTGTFDWNTYYQPVPAPVVTAGELAADLFQFNWQIFQNDNWNAPVISDLKNVLTSSPIHWAGMTCALDYAGIERWCNAKYYVHCRTLYNISDYLNVLDSEMPALRRLELGFPLPCCVKISLKIV